MNQSGGCLKVSVASGRWSLLQRPPLSSLTSWFGWLRLVLLLTLPLALGQVFRLSTSYCLGMRPVLSQLMQSFRRTQPSPSCRIPQWDIHLVLSVLCENRFANDRLSLEILTARTVFLLAVASGEHLGALAAPAYPPQVDESHLSISYHRDFIQKSYFVYRNVTSLSLLRTPFVWGQLRPGMFILEQWYRSSIDPLRSRPIG